MADLVQPGEPLTELMLERQPPPVYRTPRGGFARISGVPAEMWPYPRKMHVGDTLFVERPIPRGRNWGLTFHCWQPPTRNPLANFIRQYAEGRASGFPFFATFFFSARWALKFLVRR